MGGGVILGTVWGLIVSAIVLAAMSLSLPLPPRPDATPDVVETAAEVPDEGEVAEPATDRATGAAQEVPLPEGSAFNREAEEAAAIPEEDAPVDRGEPRVSPEATDTSTPPAADATPAPVPDVAAAPAAPVIPETPPATAFDVPATPTETPADADQVTDDPGPDPDAVSEVGGLEDATVEDEVVIEEIREEDVAAILSPGGASSPRLPQVAAPEDAEVAVEAPTDTDTGDTTPNALRDNAVAFDAPETGALMAVILIDDPEGGLAADTLTRFSFPVAFAIDPLAPGAATRAAIYRNAGFEVVILGDIFPEGATDTDVAQAIEGAIAVLPEAVALLDTPEGRIQGDRPILDATVDTLSVTGHGLVAFPQGLNAAEQTARREDVPAATMFRLLDDEDQRATVITRFLSRAGFAAGENGAVVVAGRTRPDTVTALFSWALGGRSGAVTLTPLSAVLQRNAAGE